MIRATPLKKRRARPIADSSLTASRIIKQQQPQPYYGSRYRDPYVNPNVPPPPGYQQRGYGGYGWN